MMNEETENLRAVPENISSFFIHNSSFRLWIPPDPVALVDVH
jgi:hypothetical protein